MNTRFSAPALGAALLLGFLLLAPLANAPAQEVADPSAVPEGINATLGQVLAAKAAQFRQTDFEVYRWTGDPLVIILDFRTLAVQDLYVKRLVFFLEKAGWRGQIGTAGWAGMRSRDLLIAE